MNEEQRLALIQAAEQVEIALARLRSVLYAQLGTSPPREANPPLPPVNERLSYVRDDNPPPAVAVPSAPPTRPVDPLTLPPAFMRGDRHPAPHALSPSRAGEMSRLYLGNLSGFDVVLRHGHIRSGAPYTILEWGCRTRTSEASAREHWRNDVSQVTAGGPARPNANAMLDWVVRICRHRGWQW